MRTFKKELIMKKIWQLILMFLAIVSLAACGRQTKSTADSASKITTNKKAAASYLQTTTPTFYVHGYQGSAHSTDTLINRAVKQADAHKILVATVANDGTVSYTGTWRKGTVNPIVQVVFANNVAPYASQSTWLMTVISELANQHHFKHYNVVAHSAGNVATVNMLMTTAQPTNFPQIQKFVSLAGCYNGVITEDDVANQNYFLKSGEPALKHSVYQMLDAKRQNFPNHISILNIMGDLKDGSHSDELVSEVSARSLKYLIRGHQTNYQEKLFYGHHAQHSKLHENKKVATTINQYLWGK